jgi:hypothetical protein
MATDAEVEEARTLIAYDWLSPKHGRLLHFADLTEEQLANIWDYRAILFNVALACNRKAKWLSIPGISARIAFARCPRCCKVKGYPEGKGSPKNDTACRVLLRGEGVLP